MPAVHPIRKRRIRSEAWCDVLLVSVLERHGLPMPRLLPDGSIRARVFFVHTSELRDPYSPRRPHRIAARVYVPLALRRAARRLGRSRTRRRAPRRTARASPSDSPEPPSPRDLTVPHLPVRFSDDSPVFMARLHDFSSRRATRPLEEQVLSDRSRHHDCRAADFRPDGRPAAVATPRGPRARPRGRAARAADGR